ncbi:hypothetical protein [Rhodopirellula sallentina]|uniref:Membrane protein n=1 Tax=Rhodopirellula sallentina SM41 TaxID=1263870 RepID=M5TVZ0_9BACT|nr:hypothetical protein [Rhodopirellula sallentina]EMI53340.1 membrane protein [Rhodopirellula sallentina SM41]
MSEPAVFVVIRDHEKRFYYDRWAHVFLYRNLVWGPDALDSWLAGEQPHDDDGDWFAESCGGVVVDHDRRKITWDGDDEALSVPRVSNVLNTLLETAWQGYDVEYAVHGLQSLANAAGVELEDEDVEDDDFEDQDADEDKLDEEFSDEEFADAPPQRSQTRLIESKEERLGDRPETVRDAAGIYDEDELDEDEEEDEPGEFEDDSPRAWITLINEQGVVRHRHLEELSRDLFLCDKNAFRQLLALKPNDVPPESVVTEGIWFDFKRREIGYWGNHQARRDLAVLQRSWQQWHVQWAENGYTDHCAVSGPIGIPMTDEEALATLTPRILSTKRIDLGNIIGALGGQLKKTVVKGVGCLTVLICLPVLLFGLIAGKMQAALITIGVVVVGVAIVFKLVERKFKRKFNDSSIGMFARDQDAAETRAPVAGPLDPAERRARLDQLLLAAGLPPLQDIEKHVDEDDELKELL